MAKVKQRTIQRAKRKAAWSRLVANSFDGDPLSGVVAEKPKTSMQRHSDDVKLFAILMFTMMAILLIGIFAPQ